MKFKKVEPWQSIPDRYGFWVISWTIALLAITTLFTWLLAPKPVHARDKISPDLQVALQDSGANDHLRFIVHLQAKASFPRASLPADKLERRTLIIQQLQETAVSSQASLIAELENWQANGHVNHYRPLWIINAIVVEGVDDLIAQIADRYEVKKIELDSSRPLIPLPTEAEHAAFFQFSPTNPPTKTLSWGLERIRAPHVWHGLGIDGSGMTIGIMDSGVDWLHPDLFPNYRGNLGNGNIQHLGNWFNAASPTMTVPIDFIGHGTHVAGTAVGQNGIGVAPGAQWMATSIVDQHGFIFDSYIHAGFEWLLAPLGNPNLAPNIINGSWGGPGINNLFLEDIETLHTAGIITVFSAGNTGPTAGSVQWPASYIDTLAVGASDNRDELTWFSSRGPSFFTAEPHPHLIAPGTRILSTFPGNLYALATGTSMSAPHVAGTVALLWSANPSLSLEQVKQALLTTAVPVSSTHPNNDSGWGRLDAYTAVSQHTPAGALQGIVQSNGIPLPGIPITIITSSGSHLSLITDENGSYQAALQPGTYVLTINLFGYEPYLASNLTINTVNHTLIHNIDLVTLSSGTVTGFVRTSEAHTPLAATIHAAGTPIAATTDSNGYYTLTLPAGQYEIVVKAIGRRPSRITVTVIPDHTLHHSFYLAAGPAILLVDSGQWYYDSKIDYYQDSLDNLNYSYDLWEIHNPFTGSPHNEDLQIYDTVIWSAPLDSPGIVSAGTVLTHFLKTGGHFFVSGQNVASFDGFGFGAQSWWYRDLEARYVGPVNNEPFTLTGAADTVFEGLDIALNGVASAQNQTEPDSSIPASQSLTQPIFQYGDGRFGGLQRSHCKPFSLVYLGFGLEGITGAANRQAILERSFDFFNAPPIDVGLRWQTADIDDFALPGKQLVYTVTLQNLSETITDTFHFQLENSQWNATLITPTLSIGPCQTGHIVFTLDVPAALPNGTIHTMEVTAVSTNSPANTAQLHIRHKIPDKILFVDDDRWYDRQGVILDTLDQMGLTYDIWETGWAIQRGRGSPSAEFLQVYDIIIWYTGYDWFRPVTDQENEALYDYLAQGGRLFLTSQDYLYYHSHQPTVQNFFGLLTHQESITPTQIYAGDTAVVPNKLAGPVPLGYQPYQNFSDGLIPKQLEQAVLWSDQGMAVGIANSGLTTHNRDWRLLFWSIPFETMTNTAHLPAMNGIMGWLGDLGESTLGTENRVVARGNPQTYTLRLKNLPSAPTNQVQVTNTLPVGLDIVPGTVSGGATYDTATRQLTWQGNLAAGAERLIRYQAIPSGGSRLDNQVTIVYERHNIAFNQTATVWVDAPDLSGSQLTAVANTPYSPLVTYTLRLQNDGFTTTQGISAVVRLPDAFHPLTDTLYFDQGTGFLADQRIHWHGDLIPGEAMTMTLHLTATTPSKLSWHSATAVIQDGVTDTQIFNHVLALRPFTYYWPFVANQ